MGIVNIYALSLNYKHKATQQENGVYCKFNLKYEIMKKKLFFILSVCVILLTSCHSFEREAHHALRDEIKATAKNPDSYKISDEETIFQQDSMVVISFVGNGENGYGGRSTSRYEFIYGYISKNEKRACLRGIDEDENSTLGEGTKSITRTIKSIESGGDGVTNDLIKGIMEAKKCDKKEAANSYISLMASCVLIFKGHDVK